VQLNEGLYPDRFAVGGFAACMAPCSVRTVLSGPACAHFTADTTFDFQSYMVDTAKLVNKALDMAIPAKYPEKLTESMRYGELATWA